MFRLIIIVMFACCLSTAQGDVNLAGSAEGFAAVAYGPSAVSYNPANLTMFPGTYLELLSLRGGAGNNSYSISDYNRFNGSFWDDEMKKEILSKIDGKTFSFNGDINARAAGFSLAGFAVTTETRLVSSIDVPKEMCELILNGNTIGRTFSIDNADGAGIAFTEMRFSAARPLVSVFPVESTRFDKWHGGLTLKILKGWGYGELLEAEGGLQTTEEMVYGNGRFRSLYARGGSGLGFDLGFAGPVSDNWIGSLAVRDLFTKINWTRDVEERIETFEVPGLVLGDSVSVNSDSVTRSLSQTETALPAIFSIGAARQWTRWLAAGQIQLATGTRYGASSSPRASMGTAWKMRSWLVVRASAAAGGDRASNVGGSLGIAVGAIHVNLGLHSWGSLNPFASKGFGLISALAVKL